MPHERFQGSSKLGFRGDAIVELDWCVGELLSALDRLKLASNTLVVFCSDNGPVLDDGYQDGAIEKNGSHRAAGPYRGGKYSVYEGGTRTPLITRWTGKIQPATSEALVCTIDFAASFAALSGQKVPANSCGDSRNVLDALLGIAGSKGRDNLVTQNNGSNGIFGYRNGKWKLLRHDNKKAFNLVVEKPLATTPVPQFQLFDLDSDPFEKNDVINAHPEVAQRLKQELDEIIKGKR